MSELMNTRATNGEFRWQLLTTVSALAFLGYLYTSNTATAADQDEDHPTVWIELGGQMEHINGQGNSFPVGFLAANPNSPVLQPTTPLQAQRPLPLNFGEEGKISIEPEGSSWTFSATVRYGRSNNSRHVDHQTNRAQPSKYRGGVPVTITSSGGPARPQTTADFSDTQVRRQQSHMVLDFSAGKDVGLGMFGQQGSSVIEAGVRFAQFASKETFDARARPDLAVKYLPSATSPTRGVFPHFHTYHLSGQASRSFRGIGPSLSWSGSAPMLGSSQDGEVSFDWGANAALLFGRQKATVEHHESGHYAKKLKYVESGHPYHTVYQHSGGHSTNRSVAVPNVGGFAGASFRIDNFKVSMGYRADFFFGAIDGGIDKFKSETLGFYGPFASISVGFP